jgi:ATP-dependent exoDNAse (exonuclease V) alpha subunit
LEEIAMSIFHCSAKAISRATGRSSTAAAAYRAGERIIDERTGEAHDYRRKKGVLRTQVYVPSGVRVLSRSALWNMAETAEKRKDAKVAREWEVALPEELGEWERARLAYDFAKEIVKRYGVAVDVCIHAPGRKGDDRNHHAHILTSTRVLTSDGFGEKTRVLDSPRTSGQEVTAIRELWAWQCNLALAVKGIDAQLDLRSLKAQGIDREPTRHLGVAASSMERRGVRSLRGGDNRRRRDPRIERELKELAVLENLERGIEASHLRHERRKDRAEWEAELLQEAKKERRLAEQWERAANRGGMSR